MPWWTLPWLAACAEKDTPDPPPIYDVPTEDCSGTPPVAELLTLTYGGERTFEGTANVYESVDLKLLVSDADGDMDQLTFQAWWDDQPDGEVDTTGDPQAENLAVFDEEPCHVWEATIGVAIPMEVRLQWDVEYDFAARAIDKAGLASNILVITSYPPGP